MADKYIISKTKMTAIADAIRSKTGNTATLTADQMATAISGFSTTDESAEWCKKVIKGEISGDIAVPDGITTMPGYIFCYNKTIKSVNFNKMEKIPPYFANASSRLTSLTFTSKQTEIGASAFETTNIKAIEFPEAETRLTLEQYSFQYCNELNTIIFKRPVNVGISAFNIDDSYASDDFAVYFYKDSNIIQNNAFNNRSGKIAFLSSGDKTIANNSTAFSTFKGKVYVPRVYLSSYKSKTNFIPSKIYPIPKYISYTAPDGTSVVVNADDGVQTTSPLTTTYDSTSLTFVNASYDTVTRTVDLSGTDYFGTYDLGTVTMSQTNPQVIFSIPDGATGYITYDGVTTTQTATSATYRMATGSSVSYSVSLYGYRDYTGTLTTAGADTISVALTDMTALVQTDIDIITPFSDTSELGNLVDGSNFEIDTTNGYIKSGSKSYNINSGSSFGYLMIRTPSSETTLSVTYRVSSESNYDFGYAVLTDNESQCVAISSDSLRRTTATTDLSNFTSSTLYLLFKDSGNNTSTKTATFTLPANKTLYLGFGYIKDPGGNRNDDRMYITEVKYTTMK